MRTKQGTTVMETVAEQAAEECAKHTDLIAHL